VLWPIDSKQAHGDPRDIESRQLSANQRVPQFAYTILGDWLWAGPAMRVAGHGHIPQQFLDDCLSVQLRRETRKAPGGRLQAALH
jgi:hypothetical protein